MVHIKQHEKREIVIRHFESQQCRDIARPSIKLGHHD